MRTQAYRNLNKQGVVYSLRRGGRVVGYSSCVVLTDATMKHAGAPALARIRTGAREVCAWVTGNLSDAPADTSAMRRLSCDPKKHDCFCDSLTGERVDAASIVVLTTHGVYYR